MRQLFFAIVLVGAAFGGGAMVNGPALQWMQHRVSIYMGLNNGDEIASIDLPPSAGDPEADALLKSSEPRTDAAEKDRKGATAAADRGRRKPDARKRPEAKSPEPVAPAQPIPPASPPLAGPSGSPGVAPSAPPPAPLDPGVAPALLASLSPEPAPAVVDQPPPNTPASTTAPASNPNPSPDASTTSVPATGGGDWAELRRKLKSAGVTRYSIEGETAGRVVFSCLIPLAGKQAVSQQFEGEGEDEFTAARAALRRINLWRATRTASPASP